jgi:hypothetical protein
MTITAEAAPAIINVLREISPPEPVMLILSIAANLAASPQAYQACRYALASKIGPGFSPDIGIPQHHGL